MLPNRVALSTKVTDKLKYLKTQTGVTPNVLSRIAIGLALRDGTSLVNAGVSDHDGQVLNRDVLFGDYADVYDALLSQYIAENDIDMPISEVITALIEIGCFKMGHVKNVQDLVF